ncbi:MAG: thiamine pyrophosphate TPP-binding protein [Chloroflexi bacterium]|nr:thiamine pyrophosphate TPP-binding protein [Chloroflexota bacterium]
MVSSGASGGILADIDHRDPVIYNAGMPYTSAACLGVALARPDVRVVAIEGDGAILMALSTLVTVGRYLPKNLVVLVVNNRTYRTTGGGELETATAGRADVAGFARAAGIPRVETVDAPEECEQAMRRAMTEDGPWVVVCNVDSTLVRPSGRAGPPPRDRTELAMDFSRHLREVRPAPPGAGLPKLQGLTRLPEMVGPGEPAGRAIYGALKAAGINFLVYLPESVLYPVMTLAEFDPDMPAVCCTREDEGIAIANGAAYVGYLPAFVCEGTGVGMSALILAAAIVRRAPLLILSSHPRLLGIRQDHDDIACMTNEPILNALNIPCAVLNHLADAGLVIRASARSAEVLKSPVGVAIPPHLMDETE